MASRDFAVQKHGEFSPAQAEGVAKLEQRQKAGVAFPALDSASIRAMNAGSVCEFFLAPPWLCAGCPNRRTEADEVRVLMRHTSRVAA